MHRRCRETADALAGVVPESALDTLEERINVCEVTGPPVIARQWSVIHSRGVALANLVDGALYIHDERIFIALRGAVLDETRADVIRIAAMNVLASYAAPGVARAPLQESTEGTALVFVSDRDTIPGDQPIAGSATQRVLDVLSQATGGRDTTWVPGRQHPGMRGGVRVSELLPPPADPHVYAIHLREAIATQVKIEQFPVRVPNVTVSYVCGNKFGVRNSTPFALAMSYDVIGPTAPLNGLQQFDLRVPAASGAGDSVEVFVTTATKGTVRLFFVGQQIGTRPNGGTTCPP